MDRSISFVGDCRVMGVVGGLDRGCSFVGERRLMA